MSDPLFLPEIRELMANNDIKGLDKFCSASHPAIIAEYIAALHPKEIGRILRSIDIKVAVDILGNMDESLLIEVFEEMNTSDVVLLITAMPHDDRADLVMNLSDDKRDEVMPALAKAEREDIRKLAAYEEGTAGSVMTSDYATLSPDITVSEAIEKLRIEAPDKETIYYAYVLDKSRKLIGIVSLQKLIVSKPGAIIRNIMVTDFVVAKAQEDQESVARKIAKYDILALPIVNERDALVGIVTYDDAIDIFEQEHTEDIEKLMAISGKHEAGTYLRTPAWVHFKNRAAWIVGLALVGLVSGMIIHSFDDLLASLMILTIYLPMIADTGGNTGSQSATVVVQALARGEIKLSDTFKVLFKELQVSVMLAAVVGLISYGRVLFMSSGIEIPLGLSLQGIGLAIGLALAIQVITATVIGALLPLIAVKCRQDPAVVASPALTTFVDISGLLIYFLIVQAVLGL